METILNFVKDNKIKIEVMIVILIIFIIGTCLFLNHKKKEYNVTEVSNYRYYQLNQNGQYGVIDTTGRIVIEPIYKSVKIPNPEKAVFICEKDEKHITLNEKKEEIFTKYEEVTAISTSGVVSSIPYEKTVLRYKQNGKYGLIDYNGKEITKAIYEEIQGLVNKESEILVKKAGKYGVINAKGAKLIKEEYDEITADGFYEEHKKYGLSGYIVGNKTTQGYRYGYINYKREKVLDTQYNTISRILDIDDSKNVYIIASKNGQYGVIKNDKILINHAYQGIEYDKNNKIFELQRNSQYGISNINGKEIIPVEYSTIESKGIYLSAFKNEEEGDTYFDIEGKKVENFEYASMMKTDNDAYYITINEDGFYGIVNRDKKQLVENKYHYLEYLFGEYFIVAKEDSSLGVINTQDEVLVECKYEVLQKIQDTNVIEAKILQEDRSELYSNDLQKIYSANNVSIYKENNYLKVFSKEEVEYFDFNGHKMNTNEIFKDHLLLAVKKDNKWGFMDREGNIVIDCQYDRVTEFNEYGFAGIQQGTKWGSINEKGEVVIEPTYLIEESNIEPEFLGKYYKVYYGYGESYYTSQVNE